MCWTLNNIPDLSNKDWEFKGEIVDLLEGSNITIDDGSGRKVKELFGEIKTGEGKHVTYVSTISLDTVRDVAILLKLALEEGYRQGRISQAGPLEIPYA